MAGHDTISKQAFKEITAQAVRNIARRNASMPATKPVSVQA